MRTMRVLVADDSQPIRERLIERLSRIPDIKVAEAVDTQDALRQTVTFMPDVAVLDIRMPGGGGIKALGEIKKQKPDTTVIIMTNYPYAQYRRKCLDAGADFFFDKSSEFELVADTVRQLVLTGGETGDVARRTAAAQLVAAKEQLEKIEQRDRDMSILSLLQKPSSADDPDHAYTMWEKTFDAIPDLVAIFNTDHEIVRVNKAMADRLGVPAAELTGKKCFKYMHGTCCPVDGCPHNTMLRDLKDHSVEIYENHLNCWFDITVSPVFEKGGLIGAIHIARDITKRKQAEALAHSTLDALSAHIAIVDESGAILAVNRPWSDFAHQNHLLCGEGVGSNYLEVCDSAKGPHEDDARQFARGLRSVLNGECEFFEMEYLCETETQQLWFCGRVTLFPGSHPRLAAIAHEDITARKAAGMRVRESERRYRQLFESMKTGFALHEIICDGNGVPFDYRFLEVNPAFESLTGLKAADLVGRTIREVMPSTEPVWIQTYGKVALTGQPVQIENFSTALGKHYSVSTYSPRKGQFATIFTDVTEQKNAETAIRRARDAAEEANRAKTQLLANMSHELRTPLNAIIGLTELLKGSSLDEEQSDYIKTIGSSGEALLSLISDLLDFSKIEMGKMEVRSEEFDLRGIIERSFSLLSHLLQGKNIAVTHTIDPDVPERIMGDAHRLQQVLVNLMNNAIKFTEKGFVKLTVKNRQAPSGSRRIEFTVADSGEGMSEATMKKMFRPFEQGDGSTTRTHGGSGLGLAISKNLVEQMGGSIHVKSMTGKGSVFTFDILDRTLLPGAISAEEVRQQWRGMCICVWDDNPADLRTIEHLLERCGITPRYAESIDIINSRLVNDVPADAVLCNLDMPGLAEHLPELRRMRPDVPWIAFSNWMRPVDQQIESCFSACIDRPIRPEQLYGALFKLPADKRPTP